MDLLNQNQYQNPKTTGGKKIIIGLIALSVILVIAIICILMYLVSNQSVKNTLYINDEAIEISETLIVSDTQGIQYIELKTIANLLGYEYYNSEYNIAGEETAKCYIRNKNLITGFETDSNKIYKYEEGTNLDYQHYTLKYNVTTYNGKLYLALTDLAKSLNVYCTVNENKEIKINTLEYLVEYYKEQLREKGYTLVTEQNNQKALTYGWIIVSKNGLYSVLNTQFEEIISAKYTSIYFDEYNLNYIVSNSNGQYGIISNEGILQVSLKYDGLEVLNYENMLYKVKNNGKYGIMKSDGTMLTEIVYDEIGYDEETENKILNTLIIPELDGTSGPLIVVKQNPYYGLITVRTGETFLPCDHLEKLYSKRNLEKIEYRIEAEEQNWSLIDYLRYRQIYVLELN